MNPPPEKDPPMRADEMNFAGVSELEKVFGDFLS